MHSPFYRPRIPYWYPYDYQRHMQREARCAMSDGFGEQVAMLADGNENKAREELRKRQQAERNQIEYQKFVDHQLATDMAANPYGSPSFRRTTKNLDLALVGDGCTRCLRRNGSIESLTSKNVELLKRNAELKQEVNRLQNEVEAQKRNARFGPQYRF